jgi:hypothetical protein
MRTLVLLSILTLATLQTSNAAEAAPDCKLKQVASIDLTVSNNRIYLPVVLGEHAALMMLNTQSGVSVLWAEIAAKYGLPHTNLAKGIDASFGRQRISQYAIATPFKLGSVTIKEAQFALVSVDGPSAEGTMDVAGLVGMDFFNTVDVELDVRNKHMNLFSQDHCRGAVVYWTNTYAEVPLHHGRIGTWYFPMELDGKKIEATLATGAPQTTLTTDVTGKLYGFDEHSRDIETETNGAGKPVAQYRAMALTAKGLNVNNTRIRLLPGKKECGLRINGAEDNAAQYANCIGSESPLYLGMNILQQLHLYLATKENVLYVSSADAPPK